MEKLERFKTLTALDHAIDLLSKEGKEARSSAEYATRRLYRGLPKDSTEAERYIQSRKRFISKVEKDEQKAFEHIRLLQELKHSL